MILQLRKQQFGTSSEKLSPDQMALFDEAEEEREGMLRFNVQRG